MNLYEHRDHYFIPSLVWRDTPSGQFKSLRQLAIEESARGANVPWFETEFFSKALKASRTLFVKTLVSKISCTLPIRNLLVAAKN